MYTPEKELETPFRALMSYLIRTNAETIHSGAFAVSRASRQRQGTGNHHGCTPPDLVLVLQGLIKVINAPQRDSLAAWITKLHYVGPITRPPPNGWTDVCPR